VTAVDRDGPPFNRFIYSLLPTTDHDDVESPVFVVDPDTGTVRTTRTLDRERQAVYRLTAVATELAHPHSSSTANVTVFVADRNDNAPVVTPWNQSAVVSLYAAAGHVFARVTATDADWGRNARLRYTITGGDQPSAAGAFDIGAGSGVVSVRRDLSVVLPAHVTRLTLDVVVRDSGLSPLNATATLVVLIDRATTGRRDGWHRGRLPRGRGDTTGHWLTTFGTEFSRELVILLAAGIAMVVIVLLIAIVCVRRRQLSALAAGGADQVGPRHGVRDDTKSLPEIVEVGWTSYTGPAGSHGEPDFQIVRNIVDSSSWDHNRRRDSAPWKSATLQTSPSRVMSAAGHVDDPESCYLTTSTSPCVRQNHVPQLQTFSVSSTCLPIHIFTVSLCM